MKNPSRHCPAESTLRVIGGRWKVPILWHLSTAGTLRFNELRRELSACTPRMLTQQLREMESDGIILRKVYPQVPPKVEYSLTTQGRSLAPVVRAMCQWGGEAQMNESEVQGLGRKTDGRPSAHPLKWGGV